MIKIVTGQNNVADSKTLAITREYKYESRGEILLVMECEIRLTAQTPPPRSVVFNSDVFYATVGELDSSTQAGCQRSIIRSKAGRFLEIENNPPSADEPGLTLGSTSVTRYDVECLFNTNHNLNRVIKITISDVTAWDYGRWACHTTDGTNTYHNATITEAEGSLDPRKLEETTWSFKTSEAKITTYGEFESVNLLDNFFINVTVTNKTDNTAISSLSNLTSSSPAATNPPLHPIQIRLAVENEDKPLIISSEVFNKNNNAMKTRAPGSTQCQISPPGGSDNTASRDETLSYNLMMAQEDKDQIPPLVPTACFVGRERYSSDLREDYFSTESPCYDFDAVISENTLRENPNTFGVTNNLVFNGSLFDPIPTTSDTTGGLIVNVDLPKARVLIEDPGEAGIKPVKVGAYYPRYNVMGSTPETEVGDELGDQTFDVHSLPSKQLIADYYEALAVGFKRYKTVRVIAVDQSDRTVDRVSLSSCQLPGDKLNTPYYIVYVASPNCGVYGLRGCNANDKFEVKTLASTYLFDLNIISTVWVASGTGNENRFHFGTGMPCVYKNIYCFANLRTEADPLRELLFANKPVCETPQGASGWSVSMKVYSSEECVLETTDDYRISNFYETTGYYHDIPIMSPPRQIDMFCSTALIPVKLEQELTKEFMHPSAVQMIPYEQITDREISCPCMQLINTCEGEGGEIGSLSLPKEFPLLMMNSKDIRKDFWVEFMGMRSTKKDSEDMLIDFMCHTVEYFSTFHNAIAYIPFIAKAYYEAVQYSGVLSRFLPNPTLEVVHGTGENVDKIFLYMGKLPTKCLGAPDLEIFVSMSHLSDTGSIKHMRVLRFKVDEQWESVMETQILPPDRAEMFPESPYNIISLTPDFTSGFSTMKMTLTKSEFIDNDGVPFVPSITLGYGMGLDFITTEISAEAAQKYFLEASTDCSYDDYTFTLGRPSDKSIVLTTTWTEGCAPPTSTKLWMTLGTSASTDISLTCLTNGDAYINNNVWVLNRTEEVLHHSDYINNQASFCEQPSTEEQRMTMVFNIDETYLPALYVQVRMIENVKNLYKLINVPYTNVSTDTSCMNLPNTFRPEITVIEEENQVPQSITIGCSVPNYLTIPRLCHTPSPQFNMRLQNEVFGVTNTFFIGTEIDENGTCNIIPDDQIDVDYTETVWCSKDNETGMITFTYKDSFFHTIVHQTNTISLAATCTIGYYQPTLPRVLSLTDHIGGAILLFEPAGGPADDVEFIIPEDDTPTSIRIIQISIYITVGLCIMSLAISYSVRWINKRKQKVLLRLAEEGGVKKGGELQVYCQRAELQDNYSVANMLILKS